MSSLAQRHAKKHERVFRGLRRLFGHLQRIDVRKSHCVGLVVCYSFACFLEAGVAADLLLVCAWAAAALLLGCCWCAGVLLVCCCCACLLSLWLAAASWLSNPSLPPAGFRIPPPGLKSFLSLPFSSSQHVGKCAGSFVSIACLQHIVSRQMLCAFDSVVPFGLISQALPTGR